MALELNDLLTCINLEVVEEGRLWRGSNLPLDYHRVFGGQILAQALTALHLASPDKQVKSLSVLFPREGDAGKPLEYDVTRHQDGRTFGASSVVVRQEGKVVAVGQASMHAPDTGIGWEAQRPVPAVGAPGDAKPTDLGIIPWEVRVVDGVDLDSHDEGPPELALWMRAEGAPAAPAVNQALIAHATDLTLIGTALRPVPGLSHVDSQKAFHSAVTSHSLWFHRPFHLADWLLVAQESPVLTGARAYGRGDVFTAAGELVASFAQESMVRPLPQG